MFKKINILISANMRNMAKKDRNRANNSGQIHRRHHHHDFNKLSFLQYSHFLFLPLHLSLFVWFSFGSIYFPFQMWLLRIQSIFIVGNLE